MALGNVPRTSQDVVLPEGRSRCDRSCRDRRSPALSDGMDMRAYGRLSVNPVSVTEPWLACRRIDFDYTAFGQMRARVRTLG